VIDQQRPKVAGGRMKFGTASLRLPLPVPAATESLPLSERRQQLQRYGQGFGLRDIVLGGLATTLVLVAVWFYLGG
jgi:hypothetical protein